MLQTLEGPGDAELISAVRGGDVDAYGQLFERHVEAARRLARQLVAAGDVDDLVSDAFAKVLVVLQRGGGPDLAFRAYLLTAVRRLRVDRLRAGYKLQVTDDMEAFDPGVPFRDTAVEGFENAAAARAFASLPERWQAVLWHTEVEGQKPAEVAVLLGMTPNSVSALAYRAREGLRQAFLTQHAGELDNDACRWTHQHIGAYVRDGLSRRDTAKVEQHVQECRTCAAIYLELSEVNSNLSAILGPLLLGGFAAAYVTSGKASTGVGAGIAFLLGRLRDAAIANAPAAAASGVAGAAVVTGAVFVAVQGNDNQLSSADVPLAPVVTSGSRTAGPSALAVVPGDVEPVDEAFGPALPGETPDAPGTDLPVPDPTDLPTVGPGDPSGDPTDDTPGDPGSDPSGDPGQAPGGGPSDEASGDPDRDPGNDNDPDNGPDNDPGPDTGPDNGPGDGPSDDPTRVPPPTDPTTPPTDEPTTPQTDGPTDEPAPPTPPTPSLGVATTSDCRLFVVCSIKVTVSGVPSAVDGSLTAAVHVGPPGRIRLSSADERCDSPPGNAYGRRVTCALTPGPYEFSAYAVPGSTLVFTVAAPGAQPVTSTVAFD